MIQYLFLLVLLGVDEMEEMVRQPAVIYNSGQQHIGRWYIVQGVLGDHQKA